MKDLTDGALQKELDYAKSIGNDSLQKCIDHIIRIDEKSGSETSIMNEHAPRSFYFVRRSGEVFRGNGGIIFHGPHDNGGDGGAPTFSVSLSESRETRWEIHT